MPLSGDSVLDEFHARVLTEEPVPADAIVWLQGNGYDRGSKVLDLLSTRYAPVVMVSGNLRTHDSRTTPPKSIVTVADLAAWLRTRGIPDAAILIEDQSLHTRDQAVHVLASAFACDWKTILLVASPHHQLRAFLTFVKRAEEIGWDGRIVNQPAALRWDGIPSEQEQLGRHLFAREVVRLSTYALHVASAETARSYLDRVIPSP